jgi:hypothetical protein
MTAGLNFVLRGAFTVLLLCGGPLSPVQAAALLSPPRGLYDRPIEVVMQSDVPGSTIFFTTNGNPVTIESGIPNRSAVKISSSTILKAAVYKNGKQIGAAQTHTYIFPKAVAEQTGSGFPTNWGVNNGKPVPADYEMDAEIALAPRYKDDLQKGLKAIPTLSIVLKSDDLFDSARGIYANPEKSGAEWERPASFEWIDPQSNKNFQINCGVRIQGGWNRRPDESPKHAFRLVFKKKYGNGKLRFPLFGSNAPAEFDTLVLRAGCNNSWLHWSGRERARGEYIRDQWMRDTLHDLGQPSAAGTFVHLHLNGLYWGIYNLTERPDAAFAAAHLGGVATDYDAMNAEKAVEGDKVAWNALMKTVNAGVTEDREWQKVQQMLNVDDFIDYMLANFYGANSDWDRSSNWYAARRRNPPGKFQFFVWDGERTLEGIRDSSIDFDDDESPPRIFHKLAGNDEFRKRFSDHIHRHFFNQGALTPERAAQRYRAWSDRLDLAIIAESARWGDYRRDVHRYKEGPYELYTRDEHWKPEVERILNNYFAARGNVLLEQFRSRGLLSE